MKLLLALLLAFQTPNLLITPPIPVSTKDEIAIVILNQPKSEQEIKQLLAPYRKIKLRRVFNEAITGFSVQGPPAEMTLLAAKQSITHISPVTEYRAEVE
ncbi:peptidase S8, partial [Bacillus sp. JJ1764]